jgi:prepilin-type N-terminal cleavage/methylation domain-containing protein
MTLFREAISQREKQQRAAARGFSLIELLVVAAVLLVVLGGVVSYITIALQRSKTEQTKVDLTQEGRAFVDEFERDIHQAGYPNCRMFNTGSNCSAHFNDHTMAAGLVSVSSTQIVFEGDVDGDGNVDSVWYRLVDSAGNFPPTGTCPCTIQRGQITKVDGAPLSQVPLFSQELQEVVNSGVPAAGSVYGGGLPIAGNVLFGGGTLTNTAYYAAVTTFKDFPVFSAYDQNGSIIDLPRVITTVADQPVLSCNSPTAPCIKSIRLTINLLGSGASGYDPKTGVRPVVTLVGNGRINN